MPNDASERCNRCWRDKYKLPIGLVVVAYTDGNIYRVNVCKQHQDDILEWLQVGTTPNQIKLPRLPKSVDKSKQLSLTGVIK